jgi:LysM repeat protein
MKRRLPLLVLLLVAVTAIAALMMARPSRVAASSQYPVGPWWYAEFYDARWPTTKPVYTRYDTSVNFDWGTGSPNVAVPVDNFSARWTRTVDFVGGTFKFWVTHDDGVLLWIDDQLIINQWYDQPANLEYTDGPIVPNMHFEKVNLPAGPHRIKLEYYEHGKNAVIKLGWEPVELAPSGFVPPPPTTLTEDNVHLVRPGEWLYKIAREYDVTVEVIIKANGLTSGKLTPGQVLVIPGAASAPSHVATAPAATGCRASYVVKPGDNLFRISLTFNTTVAVMATHNGLSAPYPVSAGQVLCVP